MKSENELKEFLEKCDKVSDWGMSKGPCPLLENDPDFDSKLGCCAECSFPSTILWVLNSGNNPTDNGQSRLFQEFGVNSKGE